MRLRWRASLRGRTVPAAGAGERVQEAPHVAAAGGSGRWRDALRADEQRAGPETLAVERRLEAGSAFGETWTAARVATGSKPFVKMLRYGSTFAPIANRWRLAAGLVGKALRRAVDFIAAPRRFHLNDHGRLRRAPTACAVEGRFTVEPARRCRGTPRIVSSAGAASLTAKRKRPAHRGPTEEREPEPEPIARTNQTGRGHFAAAKTGSETRLNQRDCAQGSPTGRRASARPCRRSPSRRPRPCCCPGTSRTRTRTCWCRPPTSRHRGRW